MLLQNVLNFDSHLVDLEGVLFQRRPGRFASNLSQAFDILRHFCLVAVEEVEAVENWTGKRRT